MDTTKTYAYSHGIWDCNERSRKYLKSHGLKLNENNNMTCSSYFKKANSIPGIIRKRTKNKMTIILMPLYKFMRNHMQNIVYRSGHHILKIGFYRTENGP